MALLKALRRRDSAMMEGPVERLRSDEWTTGEEGNVSGVCLGARSKLGWWREESDGVENN